MKGSSARVHALTTMRHGRAIGANTPKAERRKGNMALKQSDNTCHTHFFVDGKRFRQSLETSDWREAQRKEKELITQASQGKLAPGSNQFAKLTFTEAAEKNLAERLAHL